MSTTILPKTAVVAWGRQAVRKTIFCRYMSDVTVEDILEHAVVKVRGDVPYGTREYLLVPPRTSLKDLRNPKGASLILARLRAHRNIVFGATLHYEGFKEKSMLLEACSPLLQSALQDCHSNGEQPQALATLHGLCAWVEKELTKYQASTENCSDLSEELATLFQSFTDVELGAVQAIATGVPRPGHSVVGEGTFNDAEAAWKILAKLYVGNKVDPTNEAALYESEGGQLVEIEHLADSKPDYLKSAGGAMARFFFM